MKMNLKIASLLFATTLFGCSSAEVSQAERGQMYGKTGWILAYSGTTGFYGSTLTPGTYYTGIYDEIKKVDCSQKTQKETLQALTKDGVQFALDIYIRYSIPCDSNESVQDVLRSFNPGWADDANHPEWKHTIFGSQMYDTYLRPALGEAVRSSVSPFIANEININREKIFQDIRTKVFELVSKDARAKKHVTVFDMNLSNLDFPDSMDVANTDRATVSILKDKAIAEKDKVIAEIETAKIKKQLADTTTDIEAIRIDKVGAALKRNPEFMQFDLQSKMTDIYNNAGQKGNLTILQAPTPQMFMKVPEKDKK